MGRGMEFSKEWGDDNKARGEDKVMSTVGGAVTSRFRTRTQLPGKLAQSQV